MSEEVLAVLLLACLRHPCVGVPGGFRLKRSLRGVLQAAGFPDVSPSFAALEHFVRQFRAGHTTAAANVSLLLLGPSGAGKTTLLHRWKTGEYTDQLDSTDGFQLGKCLS